MFRSNLLRYFFTDTSQFLLGSWNTFESWFKSRKWLRILGTALPLVLLGSLGVPVLRGISLDKRALTSRYAQMAAVEAEKLEKPQIEEDNTQAPVVQTTEKSTGMPLIEIAYRRLLTTEPFNQKARFYVAKVMERRGQLSQTRSLMQELAPLNSVGFAEAHAWLARDIIKRAQRTKSSLPERELMHHLKANAEAPKSDPEILTLQATILERQGNTPQAIASLEKAVSISDEYALNLALLYQRNSKGDLQKGSAKRAQAYYEKELKKIDDQTAEEVREELVSQLGLSLALQDDLDEAIRVLSAAIRKDLPCLTIRNTLSSVYVFRFQKQLDTVKRLEALNLADLESAMSLDPANPIVASLVSQLLAMQSQQNPPLRSMLERNITQGGSSAMLHLLLANEAILGSRFTDAIPHLEIALSHHPNNMTVLNNFALVLVSKSPPETKRALEMINKAIEVAGEVGELMDTKGQILVIAGQDIEAIRCFEKAIAQQPGRLKTRERLADLYDKQKMTDMANAQRDAIVFIQEKIKEANAKQANRQGAQTNNSPLPDRCIAPDLTAAPPAP
jgi:tetratricopeptide (TPR) repeat protein